MEASAPMPLMSYLDEIADPRRTGYAHRHDLQEMLVIAICATLSDVDTFEDVAFWATQKEAWLKRFLKLANGIPSHDTFNRVFRILDPKAFEDAFRRWVSGLIPAVEGTLAVDGKTVRGSGDGKARPIHLVSAFATDLGIVLGQEKVARKSNEITAIPELLNALLIKGYLVTIDAMGCQTEIAETIVAKEADYLLAVKGNQPTLLTTLQDRFALDQRDALRESAHCFEHVGNPMATWLPSVLGWPPIRVKWIRRAGLTARCWQQSSPCALWAASPPIWNAAITSRPV
jgi:predicted transposase YbfD/YdcC